MRVLIMVLNLYYQLQFYFCLTFATGEYQNIAKTIFKDYDPGVRPVSKASTVTKVFLHYGVVKLLNVEQVSKAFECQMFMEMIWKDENLKWDENQFGNVSSIRYPASKVWLPDIILINSQDLRQGSTITASTNVVINSDGTIYNTFITNFKVACVKMDMSRFPFDENECIMRFGSWTYAGEEVDLFDDMTSYTIAESLKLRPNSEWDVTVKSSEKIAPITCCPNGTYPELRVPILLKRHPVYYIINVLLPITVTCTVCFVGMFSPSTNTGERTEKVFLGITTLLAVSLLMFSVSSQIPVIPGVPTIGIYLGTYLATISFAIICTTVIMWIDFRGLNGKPLPNWAKTIILDRLGKFLFVYGIDDDIQNRRCKVGNIPEEDVAQTLPDKNASLKEDKFENDNVQMVNRIESFINTMLNEKRAKERCRKIRHEWSLFCIVLDRICLITFLGFSIIFTILLFSIK